MPGIASPVELDRIIAEFVERLSREIRVEAVILFGSYVNGHPHEWSDIDVAVISPDFEGLRMPQRQELIARLMGGVVDSRVIAFGYSASAYRHPEESFLAEILRTGKKVYEAPSAA